jgi:hypothetical protein
LVCIAPWSIDSSFWLRRAAPATQGLFNLGAARLCAWLSELNLGSAQARVPDSCCPASAEQTFSAHNPVRGLSDRWLKTGRYQVVESIDHCAMQTNHCAADACLRVL